MFVWGMGREREVRRAPVWQAESRDQGFSGVGVIPSRAGSSFFFPHQGTVYKCERLLPGP